MSTTTRKHIQFRPSEDVAAMLEHPTESPGMVAHRLIRRYAWLIEQLTPPRISADERAMLEALATARPVATIDDLLAMLREPHAAPSWHDLADRIESMPVLEMLGLLVSIEPAP